MTTFQRIIATAVSFLITGLIMLFLINHPTMIAVLVAIAWLFGLGLWAGLEWVFVIKPTRDEKRTR